MYSFRHQANLLVRGALLLTLLVSLFGSGQTAIAQGSQPQWDTEEVLFRLGIQQPAGADRTALSIQAAQQIRDSGLPAGTADAGAADAASQAASGLTSRLSPHAALSSAVLSSIHSSANTNYRDLILMADADGREDGAADHAGRLSSTAIGMPDGWMITRTAISEHTFANGFTSSIYYYGDSLGNVTISADTNADGSIDVTTVLNLPTIFNAFGVLNSDDQIVITGLAVNPVADLTSFPNVNGSYSFFSGKVGEILYVSYWDTGFGMRLSGTGELVQSGVLAFPIADVVSPARMQPNIQSDTGFPVTVGGAFGVVFSTFANLAGVAVDEDGSLYFHQVDLKDFTGGNIVKVTSQDLPGEGGFQDRSLATSGIVSITTLDPVNGIYRGSFGPNTQSNAVHNYSGTSPVFGNLVSLATGPNNVLYAGVARSYAATDPEAVRRTEGLFTNPEELGPTPSMIISFSDTSGAFDRCSTSTTDPGILPIADGIADVAQFGLTLQPGINNFRLFAQGSGPEVRGALPGSTADNTLQADFQLDYTLFSGLVVDEENKVYAISGGTPSGIGIDPSPQSGEILLFSDVQPFDRRADFIAMDFTQVSSSAAEGGDGKVTPFDYVFFKAPLEQASMTPAGLSGLSRGFLLYLNRTRDNPALFSSLPNGQTQADDQSSGPLNFNAFDVSQQIAGGDDWTSSSTGDNSIDPSPSGFEYLFRTLDSVSGELIPVTWYEFYLNSNGSLTFGDGDVAGTSSADSFTSGPPRVAGAWTDLNPGARWEGGFGATFPVQALGFAGINHFIVRWINVPSAGAEICGSSNTFSISLYDDGTGIDEDLSGAANLEGPTDLHYAYEPENDLIAGASTRSDGSGNLCFTYGRMDLLGSEAASGKVLVGVTPGGQTLSAAGIDLDQEARAGDVPFPFQQGIALGSTPPTMAFEFFTQGAAAGPTFDLRQEGNDPALSTPASQEDLNRGQVCFHNLDSQTLSFPPLPDLILQQWTALKATASSGLPVNYTVEGPCTIDASGEEKVFAGTTTGVCTVTAFQPGNDTYAATPYLQRSFQVWYGFFIPWIFR